MKISVKTDIEKVNSIKKYWHSNIRDNYVPAGGKGLKFNCQTLKIKTFSKNGHILPDLTLLDHPKPSQIMFKN